jgi:Rrf2 family protein
MKLTRACAYALHALVHLATAGRGRPLTLRHIAGARGIPEKYLGSALKLLVDAGILRSTKRPGGGFRLARPAAAISLLEVVEAVDGPLRCIDPLSEGGQGPLGGRLQAVCDQVTELLRRRLGEVRLAELAAVP